MTYHKIVMLNAGGEPDVEMMEDLAWGLNKAGHCVTTLDLTGVSGALKAASMPDELHEQTVLSGADRLRDTSADLIITCGYSGIDNFWVSRHARSPLMLDLTGKPFAALFRQAPLFQRGPMYELSLSAYCTLALSDHDHDERLGRAGFSRITCVPPGTNPDRFKPIDLTPDQHERYGADVSFVDVPPRKDWWLYRSSLWSQKARKLWTKARDLLAEQFDANIYAVTDELGHKIKTDAFQAFSERRDYYPDFLLSLGHASDKERRSSIIGALDEFGTAVFTSQPDGIEAAATRPSIDYRTELPLVYNAAAVNVCVTPTLSPSCIPQPVFDCAAAGGFIITSYLDCLAEVFQCDREIVTYRTPEELRDKVRYYLDHEQERNDIAHALREKVLREHTWEHSVPALVDCVLPGCAEAVA